MAQSATELVAKAYRSRMRAWQIAQSQVEGTLRVLFEDIVGAGDGDRLTVESRIKDESRALDKFRRKCAERRADSLDGAELEAELSDIVGAKVCAKTLSDQAAVWAELTGEGRPFEIVEEIKDYVSSPKDSGYRAQHLVLSVEVANRDPVRVEVQIKTRLQDAWGEMTHEDLYKPGGAFKPSPAHERRARVMANLLASVDELADELAQEVLRLEGGDGGTVADTDTDTDTDADIDPEPIVVRIRRTGPRYALAVDDAGRQGLISARSVRRACGLQGYIHVHDHVQVGESWSARVTEDADGTFYDPIERVDVDSSQSRG